VDKPRRREWLIASFGVVGAHAASIAVKRVVRPRPDDPSVQVLVDTPSKLSFPSSHATSTTAAAVLYSGLTGRNLVPALVPPMLASRLVLGVHYPTDVLAGAALGGLVGGLIRRKLKRR
jgi:membrane-associated phospholipid phosphatase